MPRPPTGEPVEARTPTPRPSAFLEEPLLAWLDEGPTAGSTAPGLPHGAVVGPYVLLGEIGRGGSAVVYRARGREGEGPDLALKHFPPSASGDAGAYGRERGLASCIDHPGVVRIADAGHAGDGSGYVVMPLIEGLHLDAYCRSASPAEGELAGLFLRVCEAVGHLHGLGIVHRDLKPSNILVTADGRPHVTDLGVARRDGPGDLATASGVLMGTPGYFAPEQLDPMAGPIGPATDVYGLGATLYVVLTGRPPFGSRHSLSAYVDVLCLPPARPRSRNPGVSGDLEAICLRCLEKRPADRYRTMAELGEDLRRLRDGEPVRAARGRRARRLAQRLRGHGAVVAGGLVIIVAATAIGLELLRRDRESRRAADEHLTLAQSAIEESFLILPQELSTTPRTLLAQRDLLERGRAAYRALLAKKPRDVTLRQRYGTGEFLLGLANDYLKDHAAALEARRALLATFEGLARDHPGDPLWRFKCFHSQLAIHNSHNALGDHEAAERSLAEAARLIGGLCEDSPDDPIYLDALAATTALQARRARGRGDLVSAEAHARRSREAALRLAPHAVGQATYLRHQGSSAAELALIRRDQRAWGEALEWSDAAVTGFDRLIERAPGVLDFEIDRINAELDRAAIRIAAGEPRPASRELLDLKRRVEILAEAHRDRAQLPTLVDRVEELVAGLAPGH